jgi:diadenosine tetraphosphate (Ap4A) HIT family hydrolase
MGAEILTYPSAFTRPTGKAHWEILLRSRAIENQCYVVAAAQVGEHNPKRASYGHSLIIDPWGEVLAQCEEEKSGILFATVDPDRLVDVRSRIPQLLHRRRDLFPGALGLGQTMDIGNVDYTFGEHVIPASTVFYRSLHSFAFVNLSPLVHGHVLVSPIEVVPRIGLMKPEQVADLFACVHRIAPKLEKEFGTKAITISTQDGKDAGQTVEHVHIHVLPRRPNDFTNVDDIYAELEQHDKIPTRKKRNYEEMSEEALTLRKLFY